MKVHIPANNLIYIEELLKEGFVILNEKSTMIPTKSIRINARKREKRVKYVVLVKNLF